MDELLANFIREAEAAGAGVYVASRVQVARALSRLMRGSRSVVVANALEKHIDELRGLGVEAVLDEAGGLAAGHLSDADAGICGALAGVATSGTVLVGPGTALEGFVSILPPHCIIVVERNLIYQDIAAALQATAHLVEAPGSRLVFVTGPSRTSDIELTPVVGVHGPLRLDLVIVDD